MGMLVLVIDIKHAPQVSSCPFILYDELDFLLEIPILTLLAFNFLFLLWVIIVSSIYVVRDLDCHLTFPFSDRRLKTEPADSETGPREEALQSRQGMLYIYRYL